MVRVIASLDDLDFSEKDKRTEAGGSHVLIYDGQAVEIDLSDEHDAELQKLLARYFTVGRRPTDPAVRGRGRHDAALTGSKGMGGRSRAETKAAREWARENGLVHLITTPAGGSYYKREFVDKWDAHKRSAGLSFD